MRAISIILLLLNGIGAIYGGICFILQPSGALLQADTAWLEHSPFNDFMIPGIILFTVLGIGSFITAIYTMFKFRYYPYFLIAMGGGIVIWILVQLAMIRLVYFLQYIIGGIGIIVLFCGLFLHKKLLNNTYS